MPAAKMEVRNDMTLMPRAVEVILVEEDMVGC